MNIIKSWSILNNNMLKNNHIQTTINNHIQTTRREILGSTDKEICNEFIKIKDFLNLPIYNQGWRNTYMKHLVALIYCFNIFKEKTDIGIIFLKDILNTSIWSYNKRPFLNEVIQDHLGMEFWNQPVISRGYTLCDWITEDLYDDDDSVISSRINY